MTDNRLTTDIGTVPLNAPPVKARPDLAASCGGCGHFLVVDCYPDAPAYFCASEEAKDLTPRRHWLSGPEEPVCQFFLPLEDFANGLTGSRIGHSLEERFLSQPDQFLETKAAAFLLKKSVSTVYALVDCGRLDYIRVGSTIHIYKESILRFLRMNPNGLVRR
jgi:excisionase family DNA binding protein